MVALRGRLASSTLCAGARLLQQAAQQQAATDAVLGDVRWTVGSRLGMDRTAVHHMDEAFHHAPATSSAHHQGQLRQQGAAEFNSTVTMYDNLSGGHRHRPNPPGLARGLPPFCAQGVLGVVLLCAQVVLGARAARMWCSERDDDDVTVCAGHSYQCVARMSCTP